MDEMDLLEAEYILVELQGTQVDGEGHPHAICPFCRTKFHRLDRKECSLDKCWRMHCKECRQYKKARAKWTTSNT